MFTNSVLVWRLGIREISQIGNSKIWHIHAVARVVAIQKCFRKETKLPFLL